MIGVEKVDIDEQTKEHMKDLLRQDPALFMEYASTDSVVTVLYADNAIEGSRDDRRVSDAEAAEIGDSEALSKFVEGERRSQEQQWAAHKRTRGIELG